MCVVSVACLFGKDDLVFPFLSTSDSGTNTSVTEYNRIPPGKTCKERLGMEIQRELEMAWTMGKVLRNEAPAIWMKLF